MIVLSNTSSSQKTRKAIDLIIKELDFHLCCEIIYSKKHTHTFIVKNWAISDHDYYIAHIIYRRKKTNWETLLDLIPILGEAWVHYDYFSSMTSYAVDGMSRLDELYYYWKTGINYLMSEGYQIDQKACYNHMLEQTTRWNDLIEGDENE